jgi:DNA-binding MarR family transcriptional regulator
MTSQVVRTLEAKGLLSRDVDHADTRARRLTLTPRGRTLARRAITAVEDADAAFFGSHERSAVRLLGHLLTDRS